LTRSEKSEDPPPRSFPLFSTLREGSLILTTFPSFLPVTRPSPFGPFWLLNSPGSNRRHPFAFTFSRAAASGVSLFSPFPLVLLSSPSSTVQKPKRAVISSGFVPSPGGFNPSLFGNLPMLVERIVALQRINPFFSGDRQPLL